jgi:hypothetical protein
MKRMILPALVMLLVVAACEHQPVELPSYLTPAAGFEPENCPGHGSCVFNYYEKSSLNTNDGEYGVQYELKDGGNLVFHFEYTRYNEPLIMDAGYSESVWFEVKPDGDSFLIETGDLRAAGAVFGRFCFCMDAGYFRITDGCIYGRKSGKNSWEIIFNLTAASESNSWNRMKQVNFVRSARPD